MFDRVLNTPLSVSFSLTGWMSIHATSSHVLRKILDAMIGFLLIDAVATGYSDRDIKSSSDKKTLLINCSETFWRMPHEDFFVLKAVIHRCFKISAFQNFEKIHKKSPTMESFFRKLLAWILVIVFQKKTSEWMLLFHLNFFWFVLGEMSCCVQSYCLLFLPILNKVIMIVIITVVSIIIIITKTIITIIATT